jgi:hypothetical protein
VVWQNEGRIDAALLIGRNNPLARYYFHIGADRSPVFDHQAPKLSTRQTQRVKPRGAQQIAVKGSSGKIIVADQNWRILDEVGF